MERAWCTNPETIIDATSFSLAGLILPALFTLYLFSVIRNPRVPERASRNDLNISIEVSNDANIRLFEIVSISFLLFGTMLWTLSERKKNNTALKSSPTVQTSEVTRVYPQHLSSLINGHSKIWIEDGPKTETGDSIGAPIHLQSSTFSIYKGLIKGCVNPSCGLVVGDTVKVTRNGGRVLKLEVCRAPN